MNFDDRLATVLSSEVRGTHDRAVRWRQLVDLVARAAPDSSPHLLTTAIAALRAGRDQVAVPLRAAAARAIAGRALPRALLELFASDALEVAAPLLTGISPDEALLAAASPEVRRFLRAMNEDTPASPEDIASTTSPSVPLPVPPPPPAPPISVTVATSAPVEPVAGVPTIGDFVARIERLRSEREGASPVEPTETSPPEPVAPLVPPASEPPTAPPSVSAQPPTPTIASPAALSTVDKTSPALFRWECGPGGEIGWVEGAPRGPLVGRSIARGEASEGVDREVERAFARRSPFRDAALALPDVGVIGGDWLISGVPAFAPADGRFVGYRGIARRADVLEPAAMVTLPAVPLDPAALRELVHEIKTPLNAIVGFAEIIDGQYLGPAQTGYRARAAEIVAQAQVLLAAIDDLDFAARLRGRDAAVAGVELDAFLTPLAGQIERLAQERGTSVVIEHALGEGRMPLDRELVERLVERFVGGALAAAGRDERLRLTIARDAQVAAFALTRPAGLKDWDDASLTNGDRAAMALRLVAGLAQIVGGSLAREDERIVLRLPLASAAPVGPEGFEPPT